MVDRVTVSARPTSVTLDLAHAGVVVVDMQNDFAAPGGMFHRAGLDVSGIRAAVAPTARVVDAARGCGVPVIYLKMGFQPDLSDLGPEGSANYERHTSWGVGDRVDLGDGASGRVLIRETWNTDIVDDLRPRTADVVIYKNRFSGFHRTELDEVLEARAITDLVFTGCTTSVCIEATIRDAVARDYRCVLLEDCTAEPGLGPANHDASLVAIASFAWVSTSHDFVHALA